MYEQRSNRLLSRREFAVRLLWHFVFVLGVVCVALAIGVLGYHLLGSLGWVDSLLNASMILGGMGPVDPLQSTAAKLFASFYALFSGLVFIGVSSVMFAPFLHRILHRLHLDNDH